MATEKVAVIKCDVCQRTAHTYTIQMADGQRYTVDLCEADSAPLHKLIAKGRRTARMPRSTKLVVSPRPYE